jgi:hypothetical protein
VKDNVRIGPRNRSDDELDGVEMGHRPRKLTKRIKYCLYTFNDFGDYGISVLARPEAASSALSTIQATLDTDWLSQKQIRGLNLEPAFKVVDMPEKGGKGVVATRQIDQLETFMIDYAAIIGDLDIWGSVPEKEGRELLELAAEQLANPDPVLALSRGKNGRGVEGIIAVNTFRTHLDGKPQKTLFPIISVSKILLPRNLHAGC